MTSELPVLHKKKGQDPFKLVLVGVGVFVMIVLSFVAGMQFQKSSSPKSSASTNGSLAFNGGRRGGARNGVFGTVSAVSATSITVQDNRTQSDKTLSLSSATTVMNNGAAGAISDIKVGDTVIIRVDTTDATKAASIILNPSAGGFGPGGSAPSPTSSDSQPL